MKSVQATTNETYKLTEAEIAELRSVLELTKEIKKEQIDGFLNDMKEFQTTGTDNQVFDKFVSKYIFFVRF